MKTLVILEYEEKQVVSMASVNGLTPKYARDDNGLDLYI